MSLGFRYRLWHILVAAPLVAMIVAFAVRYSVRAYNKNVAIKTIEASGGSVHTSALHTDGFLEGLHETSKGGLASQVRVSPADHSIRTVDLGPNATPKDVAAIAQLPGVETILIRYGLLTRDFGEALAELPVRNLGFIECQFRSGFWKPLSASMSIQRIQIMYSQTSGYPAIPSRELGVISHLEVLSIVGGRVELSDFCEPTAWNRLRRLELSHCDVREASCELQGVLKLRELKIEGSRWSTYPWYWVCGIASLECLFIDSTVIRDRVDALQLKELTHLKLLFLNDTDVGHNVLDQLQKELPRCRIIAEEILQSP